MFCFFDYDELTISKFWKYHMQYKTENKTVFFRKKNKSQRTFFLSVLRTIVFLYKFDILTETSQTDLHCKSWTLHFLVYIRRFIADAKIALSGACSNTFKALFWTSSNPKVSCFHSHTFFNSFLACFVDSQKSENKLNLQSHAISVNKWSEGQKGSFHSPLRSTNSEIVIKIFVAKKESWIPCWFDRYGWTISHLGNTEKFETKVVSFTTQTGPRFG